MGATAELDRRPKLPARIRRAPRGVARRARRRARRRGSAEACDEPAARLRRQGPERARGCSRRRRRSATRSATSAARTSRRSDAISTPTRCATRSSRGSSADSTTTRGRRSSSSGHSRDRSRRSARGGRYDGLIEEIGGPPTPGIGFGAGVERLIDALREEGITAEEPPLELFFLIERDADRAAALAEMARLRRASISCDTDYAGRSIKGQRTQLARSGARGFVHVRADGATIKRGDDVHDVPVEAIAATVIG